MHSVSSDRLVETLPILWLCIAGSSRGMAGQTASSSSVVSTEESSALSFCLFLGKSVREDVVFISAQVPGNEREKEMISLSCFQHEAHAFFSPSAAHNVVGSPELPALPSLWHILVMKIVSCLQNQIVSGKSRRLCEKWALCWQEKVNELVKSKSAAGMGRRHCRALLTSSGTRWRGHPRVPSPQRGRPVPQAPPVPSHMEVLGLLPYLLHRRVLLQRVTHTLDSWDPMLEANACSSYLPQAEFRDVCASLARMVIRK